MGVCSECGKPAEITERCRVAITLTMEPGPHDKTPRELCSRCWREGLLHQRKNFTVKQVKEMATHGGHTDLDDHGGGGVDSGGMPDDPRRPDEHPPDAHQQGTPAKPATKPAKRRGRKPSPA